MEKNNSKKKNLFFIIPVALAVAVIIAFAVSGHITKNNDESKPTAETSVSVVNSEETSVKKEEDAKVFLSFHTWRCPLFMDLSGKNVEFRRAACYNYNSPIISKKGYV